MMLTSEFSPDLLRQLVIAGVWIDRQTHMMAATYLLTFTALPTLS
ncbi:hypothetical protein AB0H63_31160 [Micromonospora echinospora]